MTRTTKAHLQIHFCVVLWGFTAILGKAITLRALQLVWWRMLIVTVALLLLPSVWRALRAMSPKLFAAYAGIGVVVALHWLTFYGAIKLANASVAATCIALAPVFLALIEPWIARRGFDPREVLLGLAVVPGVALVVGGVAPSMRLGLVVGTLSALLVAVFGSLNKRLVHHAEAKVMTCLELGAGCVFLTLLAPLVPHVGPAFPVPDVHDAVLLVILSLGCTLLPFTLSLVAMRELSAFTAQLVVNLEPVYAIILAVLLFHEQRELGPSFYAGVAIILAAVFVQPWLSRPKGKHPEVLGTMESKSFQDG